MTTDERFEKIEDRLDKCEEALHVREVDQLKQYRSLEQLIAKAVEEGNKGIYEKLEKLETRVAKLENQDGEKAKAVVKAILATSLSWLVMGILSNLPTILGVLKK